MAGLSIRDFADLELLHVVEDADDASTMGIAATLEVEPTSVGVRMSWMRRKGLIDRDTTGGWRVSRAGLKVLRDPGVLQDVRALAQRSTRNETTAWLARREWWRGTR